MLNDAAGRADVQDCVREQKREEEGKERRSEESIGMVDLTVAPYPPVQQL